MEYVAILDYKHLDNGLFLTNFAKAVSKQKKKGLILHGDSDYTNRLVQTGIMREEARIRAAKDLNRRLVALLADHGVSSIGLNGYQKSMILNHGSKTEIDKKLIESLPSSPLLLISNIAHNPDSGNTIFVPLPDLGYSFQKTFDLSELVVFSMREDHDTINSGFPAELRWADLKNDFKKKYLPESFHHKSELTLRLLSVNDFGKYPQNTDSILIF